ncbi:5-dehydro-4-deoxy-D-glucuronate isomerase [Adhaeribacter radiodurans]|uniref:4-deoxy-L-threo-5-hexosulose-uronate ketol-isomerase n=1 Tax=Adhaeribacter radiodurans TaxID=2745197 RepID=A0A7L7L2R3_9BACT|nr:5-dehydro-4-deoxy-D-glucuronate isomerase [Adhaeribacter radiodurans]QMU27086.1 5-dehydro-4-deoxy-D-glucuronate isomerase [Adhaeribacter radiodurans]
MKQRYHNSPREVKQMTTDHLRENFLIPSLMQPDEIVVTYSHYDRVIIGGVVPVSKNIELPNYPELRANFFLERRELGIINVGGAGEIEVDGKTFSLEKQDCLYVGKGAHFVSFRSVNQDKPALFYLLSAPAHHEFPAALMKKEEAMPTKMGALETSNERTIYKYIHKDGLQSCQLVMGLTVLATGSVWNTMPAHTHDRRMEAYFYFDVPENQVVVHLMGEPQETRHLMVHNHQAILSPPWSIHAGCGTSNYAFIWGMAGENKDYSDMDPVKITELR